MVKTASFKRLILRAVLRQVSPMVIRLVSVADQMPLHEFHDVFRTVLVQFPINVVRFGKMIFWVLCRQDLRPERWNGHFFFGQRSEVESVFLDLLC